jgi:chemotaxis signal transduction protein
MPIDVLFFEIRGRRCALPVSVVREVLASPAITPVPLAPPLLRGLAPVHGGVLPLIDLGPHLAPSNTALASSLLRSDGDRIVVVETEIASDPAPVRAAFAVNRVTRLGTVNEEHSRPPPPGPSFVSATLLDVEGPALLLDAAGVIDTVRQALRDSVVSPEEAQT